MIVLNETCSRLTIVNHLRQTVATLQSTNQPFDTMAVHLATCAIEQSYHLPADECRRAIMSARYTAAGLAPMDTLGLGLRKWREDKRRREQEQADAITAWKTNHAAEVAAEAAKLTAAEIAELPARIAHHWAIAEGGEVGKSGRKRHYKRCRELQEILEAATKLAHNAKIPSLAA